MCLMRVHNLSLHISDLLQDAKSGRTPLHHAVETGNHVVAHDLVRMGANVNATSFSGNTALHTASGRGMSHVTKILLGAGADVTVHNSQHDSAVTVANTREVGVLQNPGVVFEDIKCPYMYIFIIILHFPARLL